MKILSLFDGMACGMIAMLNAGIEVESYDAYEIDDNAIKVSSHNFPSIKHHGDVFKADFTQYEGVDYLIGGSPCTYWSIAQKNNRETEASGMGWELFSQYVRAVKEAKPKFFIYENNKSMSAAIRESIDRAFGFEAVCINSALVSAQNRQRLYWVGMRNEDGTYSKVNVDQPEDRGIILADIVDGMSWREKSYTIDSNYHKTLGQQGFDRQSGRRKMVAEPVNITTDGKSQTLKAQYFKNSIANFCCYHSTYGASGVAEPVCVAERGRLVNGKWTQRFEPRTDGKTNVLTTAQKDNQVCEPVRVGALPRPNGELSTSQAFRIYSTGGKSVNITAGGGGAGGKTGLYAFDVPLYAEPTEWGENGDPTEAKSYADGKTYPVYRVQNGQITIKGKEYPIKLADGYYIIRKLTVTECMRLQTVPEWYDFSVISNSQAYKCLGNGWTCDVITHLINACQTAARRKWLRDLLGGDL